MAKTSIRQAARYEPPRLPEYLSSSYKLKTIIGVPSEDDVKAIHAVIRVVNSASQIPALNNPSLSMQLTQHLFNAQMAIYRSVYSSGPFQEDHTYAPPTFPSHIPMHLDTVVGPPSDEQIISVHNAVRDLGNLSRVPSMFDPDLSMRLSQHLFNVQIARHIEEASQGRFAPEPSQTRSEASGPEPVSGTSGTRFAVDLQRDVLDEGEDMQPHEPGVGAGEPTNATRTNTTMPHPSNQPILPIPALESSTMTMNAPENMNSFLRTFQNINSALISVQQGLAVATVDTGFHPIVNRKGELPLKYGLPKLTYGAKRSTSGKSNYTHMRQCGTGASLSDQQLAAYLQFYEIGEGLIKVRDGKLTIAEGKNEEAEMLLGRHLIVSPGSGWAAPS